jgi:hypothetical protein
VAERFQAGGFIDAAGYRAARSVRDPQSSILFMAGLRYGF